VTWSFACPDWVERLRTGRSLVPELPLNAAEAARAVGIFDMLCLPDVPGTPPMREAAGDWFRDIVRAAFGSLEQDAAGAMVRHAGNRRCEFSAGGGDDRV
jgi:phage terminase large subunit-like protein